MKILYILTLGRTTCFFVDLIEKMVHDGHKVDIACGSSDEVPERIRALGCGIYELSCSRRPLKAGNVKAISEIKKLVNDGGYDTVHCHTPIASVCARIACSKFRKKGLRVIYTAHGFHFYRGAPKFNHIVCYTIEKLLAPMTDILVTINKEDFETAKEKLNVKSVRYVAGVGIDREKFTLSKNIDRDEKRNSVGIPIGATVILSVGELNENKNHKVIIDALAKLNNDNIHYVIAGRGDLHDALCESAAEKGVNLHLLGFREDVDELYKAADIYVLPSYREGLNVSVLEAMASGLPVICSKIRGNVDAIDENGGILCHPNDSSAFASAIDKLAKDAQLRERLGEYNVRAAANYDRSVINEQMYEIYFGKGSENEGPSHSEHE